MPFGLFGKVSAPNPFESTWDTTKTSTGSSTSTQVTLPLNSGGTYNFNVSWGDGKTDKITVFNQAETTHTYAASGTYTITITGLIKGFRFAGIGDRLKLSTITKWGCFRFSAGVGSYFNGCGNLTISATDRPWLGDTTTLSSCFQSCTSLTQVPNITTWMTAHLTTFTGVFLGCTTFNQNVNSLNVSSATSLGSMFSGCTLYNQALSSWSTSNVTTVFSMFLNCPAFNQDLSAWNVSNVSIAGSMFSGCTNFNSAPPVFSSGTLAGSQNSVFASCTNFNQSLSGWNVSNVTTMNSMFSSCTAFNQDISAWNISKVTSATSFMSGVTLSKGTYNKILATWSAITSPQVPRSTVTISFGSSHYDSSTGGFDGTAGRAVLTGTYGWTITDGGTP